MHGIPFHQRLGFKLAMAAAGVTFLPIALLCILSIRAERQGQIALVLRGAEGFSEMIRSSTHELMLDGQQDLAYQLMRSIGRQAGVAQVRVFDKTGRIVFSTRDEEQGTSVDLKAEACYACHAETKPLARLSMASRSRVYQNGGHRVLAMVTPIYNEPACSSAACHVHPPEKSVLGVVDVGISLAQVDAGIAEQTRRTVFLSVLTLVGLAALVVAAVRRLVFRPVATMVAATRRVSEGDLSVSVPVQSVDELGILQASFNDMSASLATARSELQQLAEGLERQVEERTEALKNAQEVMVQSERLTSLGKLSASIAHEINNPLAGILTFARLMIRTLEAGTPDEKARAACLKNLGLIRRETERCTTIVRSLLDFARARPLDLRPVAINAVLDEALSLTQHKLQLDGIELVRDTPDGGTVVPGDLGQLRQAFVNILLNSCDATPSGGRITVRSRVVAADSCVEIVFSDTGSGIAPENLKRIFDPFFTTKQMGTGLGLSVVYGIVEKHGGSMKVDSKEGEGTTMTLRLPLHGPEPAPAPAADA